MDQKNLDLIIGEVLIEIARSSDDIPGTVQGVLQKELPKVWQEGYEAGIAAARRNNIRVVK